MKLVITLLIMILAVVKGYQVVTKQLDMNHFQLDVVNSSKSMAIMCLYNSQEVIIQKALWRPEKQAQDSSNSCSKDSKVDQGWIEQTQKINDTCKRGSCRVPASNKY